MPPIAPTLARRRPNAIILPMTGAVARFALAGLAAMAIVGVVSFLVMRDTGTSEALSNARDVTRIVGDGKDKTAIIVDDIVDTAGSLTQTADAVMNAGATRVLAAITHPVLWDRP